MDERRDDWRHGVDENLVSLNTAQRVTDQQLDDLDLKYEALDKVLRGDPETDTDGYIARLHAVENAIQEIRAERIKLSVADVQIQGFRWDFLTKVTVQILILLGLLLLGWDRITTLLNQKDDLEEAITQAHHPKGRTLYRIRRAKAALENTKESPPNPE